MNPGFAIRQLAFFIPLAPVMVWAWLLVLMVLPGQAPVALAVTFCLAAVVLLIGYDVARRRLPGPTVDAPVPA
jgi:hypothetical protein